MSMFSTYGKKGEINGSNFRDALSQVVKYASVMEEMQPANTTVNHAPSYSMEQREALLKKALDDPQGKTALAAAMANPIRRK